MTAFGAAAGKDSPSAGGREKIKKKIHRFVFN